MGQNLGKRELSPEDKVLPKATDAESTDDVFGLNEADVNQNKDHPNKSGGMSASNAPPDGEQANPDDPNAAVPRPHLARLFSRDAPGREDNTFKDRPSESDELHTIPEAGAGAESASDDVEEDAD